MRLAENCRHVCRAIARMIEENRERRAARENQSSTHHGRPKDLAELPQSQKSTTQQASALCCGAPASEQDCTEGKGEVF